MSIDVVPCPRCDETFLHCSGVLRGRPDLRICLFETPPDTRGAIADDSPAIAALQHAGGKPLKYIQSQDRTCVYQLQLPDQSSHPDSVEVDHISFCSGRSDLKQFDARVEFQWNKAENKWEISHFGS